MAAERMAAQLANAEKQAAAAEKRKARAEERKRERGRDARGARRGWRRPREARRAQGPPAGGARNADDASAPPAASPPAPARQEDEALVQTDASCDALYRPSCASGSRAPRLRCSRTRCRTGTSRRSSGARTPPCCRPSCAARSATRSRSSRPARHGQGAAARVACAGFAGRRAAVRAVQRGRGQPVRARGRRLGRRVRARARARPPPGTAVESDDPSRRLVCATVSARAGPRSTARPSTSCSWTRRRSSSRRGRGRCSATWRTWCSRATSSSCRRWRASGPRPAPRAHLMERLVVDCGYANVVTLTGRTARRRSSSPSPTGPSTTARCAPGHTRPPRGASAGSCAPTDARRRGRRANAARRARAPRRRRRATTWSSSRPTSPSAACCSRSAPAGRAHDRLLPGPRGGRGRANLVRDSTRGMGFLDGARRMTVALTRARRELVVVASTLGAEGSWLREWHDATAG